MDADQLSIPLSVLVGKLRPVPFPVKYPNWIGLPPEEKSGFAGPVPEIRLLN
jgi:hypothetical protein